MINFDDDTGENQIKHNPDWLYIPDHPYIIIIISGTGSGKKNWIAESNKPSTKYW